MRTFTVTKNEAGQRLDKLLAKYMNLAGKSFLYKMMRKKNITLNGKKCTGDERLSEGDELRFFLSDETIEKFSQVKVPQDLKGHTALSVIYEDDFILLVNKPAGMLSQKAKDTDVSLVEYVIEYLLKTGQLTKDNLSTFRPSICNRLDRNTSGLVAAGKSLVALQIMGDVFRDRSIHKYYQCIVSGQVCNKRHIEGFLTKDRKANQVRVSAVDTGEEGSFPIRTEYEPLMVSKHYTLLKVTLITGKSHQIRAHLASIGHPVAGDGKYGDAAVNKYFRDRYQVTYQLLHSYQLVMPQLRQPLASLSGKQFTAPIPPVFQMVITGEQMEEI